jgi:transcriptional regulator with PAS, ATPase and Fis domain
MKKLLNIRLKLFHALLILLIIFFLIPIIILINQSLSKLETIKNLSNEKTETIVKEQTTRLCQSDAENIAKRISDFLISCEKDLESLSQLPPKSDTYLKFSNLHQRYVNSLKTSLPLYKEITLINKDGAEIIKIAGNKIVPIEQLRNVTIPENTTYKSEKYFEETKINDGMIYVSHLNGWYISRREQLEHGKSYPGLFRFCKKKTDDRGNFDGIYMIALDHRHIMDFIWQKPLDNQTLLTSYKTGDYNYIIDDEGWIIAHPKLWDIKGFDRNGNLIEPLSENTPEWKIEAGFIPINLMHLDWRHRDIYTDEPMSGIVKRVQRGETAIYTMTSSGIYGETEGIIRTRACAPVPYSTGPYNKFGIFGGVVVGTATENLLKKTTSFTNQLVDISKDTKSHLIFLAVILSLAVISFSFLLARFIAQTMLKWNNSLIKIGNGEFTDPEIKSPIKEITEVSAGVKRLSDELKEKDEKIKKYIKDLEIINVKFSEAQKEVDSYWKHEYEIESANVLGEKLESYEKEYPKLKKIRENLCIGDSSQFRRVLRQIIPLSQMTIPVWIYGESGVGKTALARVMHSLSPRSNKTFQVFEAIEFSAADPLIVMGKLFGYGPGHGLRGININGQKGILEECDGGTLIIDDVDALPLETQAQLLRVVDGLSFHPAAGKTRNIISNIRFIFISNVDLEQKVSERLFRKDLFRRMGGSINKIEIPPLRNRKPDISVLINFFISEYNKRHNTGLRIDNNTYNFLNNHDYAEGNIGELKMIVELACESVRLEGEKIITINHCPYININENKPIIETNYSSNVFNAKENKELAVLRQNHFQMEISEEELKYKRGSRTLSHHLRGMCLKALFHCDWDIEKAGILISNSENGKVLDIIKQRMEGYIKNISEKGMTAQEHSLFKNLPAEYHTILKSAIARFKNNSI